MYDTTALIISLILAYVLGAVPFAYLVTKLAKGIDIRRVGRGTPGALNICRPVGKGPGFAVFALDAAKGLVAIYFVRLLEVPEAVIYLAASLVAVGNNWPAFLGCSGGEGSGHSLRYLPGSDALADPNRSGLYPSWGSADAAPRSSALELDFCY